jgi:hypothetical protein
MPGLIQWAGALALLLASGPAPGAPPRCQIVPAADARLRLEVGGRELAGAKGAVAAHSVRRVAGVADRRGVMIEALFLVALQKAGASGWPGASVKQNQTVGSGVAGAGSDGSVVWTPAPPMNAASASLP